MTFEAPRTIKTQLEVRGCTCDSDVSDELLDAKFGSLILQRPSSWYGQSKAPVETLAGPFPDRNYTQSSNFTELSWTSTARGQFSNYQTGQ